MPPRPGGADRADAEVDDLLDACRKELAVRDPRKVGVPPLACALPESRKRLVYLLASLVAARTRSGADNRGERTCPGSLHRLDPGIEHAARQAYIGLGAALIAAAFEEVDATPMEGFDPAKLDEILKLRERGLRSVAIVPLGYRAAEGDWLVNLKKVRRPLERFLTEIR